ncbi:MAG: hypothetical protein LBK42_07320 [Propionibacteriaceae bacterium]|jgi:hypothetical protein|nr:hypothetical protein [Propionibacteriaceae bacterium]
MTSDPSPPAVGARQPVKVYLDANLLAAGFVRTLLLLSGPVAGHRAFWSPYAEREATRHQPKDATPIALVRELYDLEIVPDAPSPKPLRDTDEKDKPILAPAAAAGAAFVITANVKDFGANDLESLSMSAVHPDLFLTARLTSEEYRFVLDAIAEKRRRDPKTPATIHAAETPGKLPHLFLAHRDALGVDPKIRVGQPARSQFRGARCVRCAAVTPRSEALTEGLCPACRHHTGR